MEQFRTRHRQQSAFPAERDPDWTQRAQSRTVRPACSGRFSVSTTLSSRSVPDATLEFPLAADRCGSDCFRRASPYIFKDHLMSFSDLGLLPELLRGVADKAYD